MRRPLAFAAFVFAVALVAGCGDSAQTVNGAPTDKQKQKEQRPDAGPGGAGQKK